MKNRICWNLITQNIGTIPKHIGWWSRMIIFDLTQEPQKIQLSFDSEQGKYIKSLPLHYSQEVVSEDENEIVITLTIVPMYDFYQELLSHAGRVKILEPDHVRYEFLSYLQAGIKQNQ